MVEGMKEIVQLKEEWQLNVGDLRERMYRAPTLDRWLRESPAPKTGDVEEQDMD